MHHQFHARERACIRQIPDEAVAAVVAEPDLTWPSESSSGRPVTACQRGAIRVIVSDEDGSVITVMWVHSRTGGADPSPAQAERLINEVVAR
jgi:hypothetical protein